MQTTHRYNGRLLSAPNGCIHLPGVQTPIGQRSCAFYERSTWWNSLSSSPRDYNFSLNTYMSIRAVAGNLICFRTVINTVWRFFAMLEPSANVTSYLLTRCGRRRWKARLRIRIQPISGSSECRMLYPSRR